MEGPRAKITMLGTTGAGKTCFMLGMHAVCQLGINGFTLRAADDDEELRLTDEFERLLDPGEARWPAGTGQERSTVFKFSYGLKPFMEFEWLDYRGAAMHDASSKSDVQKLKEHLRGSSAVLVVISGEHLIEPPVGVRRFRISRDAGINDINKYFTELQEQGGYSPDSPLPVIITITKYDMIPAERRPEIQRDIKELFDPFFRQDAGSGFLVLVCPVSLGKELADDREGGSIDPFNMHIPLVFAFYSHVRKELLELARAAQATDARMKELQQQTFVMNLFGRRAAIGEAGAAIDVIRRDAAQRMSDLNLLLHELRDLKVFLNGQEQVLAN